MASLTDTAYYTRRTINWLIFGIIIYILLRISWSVFVMIWLTVFPPKPPPPNHAFGKLPALVFPQKPANAPNLTFKLETIEGSVPQASDSATVYFMPKKSANLLALNKTQEFASRLNFDSNPIQENKNVYRFEDSKFPLRKLRYDLITDNFIIRYAFEQDTSLFSEKNIPSTGEAAGEAKSMLQTYDLYSNDLADGTSKVTFLKYQGNKFIPTTSQSQADAVRVDFYRKSVNRLPILPPDPDEGSISIIFSGSPQPAKHLLQFAYTYWPIDYETKATYSLKTSSLAWQELQSGEGYIARYPTNGTAAVVRNVYLAYYDSYDPQVYLQPIFVFEGDFSFLGYVSAVNPDWIER